ncbi:MAG: hypothetical protein R3C30_10605 [Hyphomonadaceae bacterium]
MRWIVPSLALALAPLASSCASLPIYNSWVISDFCSNGGGDSRPWTRTEAPENADAYRAAAAVDEIGMQSVPERSREYWFALPDGQVKLCMTNLTRAEGRLHWCNPRLVVWWSFREAEDRPVIESSHAPMCFL